MTAAAPHAPAQHVAAPHATAPARTVQRPGGSAAAVITLTRTSLLAFVREPISFVMGIIYPLAMLVLFHTVFPWRINGGSPTASTCCR